jgi:hypothetical protein
MTLPPAGTVPLPSHGERFSRRARGRPSRVVWAAAGLVVIAAAIALLLSCQPGGQTHLGSEPTLCGLVPCADVPAAATSTRARHQAHTVRSQHVRSLPPAPATKPARDRRSARSLDPNPRPRPTLAPTPNSPEPTPTPTGTPIPTSTPTPTPTPTSTAVPTPTSTPSPFPIRSFA